MIGSSVKTVQILLVEDNAGDVRLAQEALRDARIDHALHVAEDGLQAMQFLRRQGDYANAPRPDIILLDLNLPLKDGREVLAEIKADPDLRRIPVVVLSTSQAEEDIIAAYDLHANCYVSKPLDFHEFIHVVRVLEEFWLTMVKLPPS